MSEFIVHTYAGEIEFLKSWVKLKETIETGGDLFGLWLNKNEVAIQLITGPGQNCRRTPVSFYQDVGYLESVGSYLTAKEGLCNVGEWHSHHRLGLARPSQGDETTVWRSMPAGLTNFVLFIANISSTKKGTSVNIGCFLFDKASHEVVTGKFVYLGEPASPLRSKGVIAILLGNGAEKEPGFGGFGTKKSKQKKRKKNKEKSQTGEGCSFEGNKEVSNVNDEEARNWTMVNRKEKYKSEERNVNIAIKEEIKKMDDKRKAINEKIQKKEKTNEEKGKDNVGNSRAKLKTDTMVLKGKKNNGKREEQRKEEKIDGVEAKENDEKIRVGDQEKVIADAAQNQNKIAEVVDRNEESTSPLNQVICHNTTVLKGRKENGKMGEQRKERKIDGEEVKETGKNESDEEIGVGHQEAIIADAVQNQNEIGEDVDKNEESTSPLNQVIRPKTTVLKGRKENRKTGEQRKERKIDGEEVEETEENESDEEIGVGHQEPIIADAVQNQNEIGEDVDKNEESKPRSGKRSKQVGKDVNENVSEKVEEKGKPFSPKHQGKRRSKKKPPTPKRGKKR